MSRKQDVITLLDISQKPLFPVSIVLEDGGLETIQWLVEKVEEVLGKVESGKSNSADHFSDIKVRVTKLVVGNLEIKGDKWSERSVEKYRILDDLWCIQTMRRPVLPPGETVTTTMVYESPVRHSLEVCSGMDSLGSISYSKGVVEFPDLSQSEGVQRRNWSNNAPKWRIARPGLCVEGKCVNKKCDANGSMVIVNMGFDVFNLPDDIHKCLCPICKDLVPPVTCGFNNCRWKWAGKKMELPNPPSIHRNKDWVVADDAYHVFDPNVEGSGKAQWMYLTIFTQDSTRPPITCKICLVPGTKTGIKNYECGHNLHIVCAKNFPIPAEQMRYSTSCPECYMKSAVEKRMGFSNFDKE